MSQRRKLVVGIVVMLLLALYMACIAHNSRLEKKRKSVGGVRCTLIRGRKIPLVPSLSSGPAALMGN